MSIRGSFRVIVFQFQSFRSYVSAEWTKALYALYCFTTSFGARQVRDQCPLLLQLWHVSSRWWVGLAGGLGFWLFFCWGADWIWYFWILWGTSKTTSPGGVISFHFTSTEGFISSTPPPLPLFELKLAFASEIAEDPVGLELWFFINTMQFCSATRRQEIRSEYLEKHRSILLLHEHIRVVKSG